MDCRQMLGTLEELESITPLEVVCHYETGTNGAEEVAPRLNEPMEKVSVSTSEASAMGRIHSEGLLMEQPPGTSQRKTFQKKQSLVNFQYHMDKSRNPSWNWKKRM